MKTPALLAYFLVPVLALTAGCTSKTKVAQKNAETAPTTTPSPVLNPVNVAVVDIQPRAYRQTRATYPSDLQNSGTSGKVLLSFVLDTDGKPTQIKSIEASDDRFIKPAIEALSRWRFYPAQKDGLPVACNLQQLFVFNAAKK